MLTLSEECKDKFQISNIFKTNNGTQKNVFCIERNGLKCVLKSFKDFGVRDIRELDIYDKYNDIDGIPKIIEIQKFEGNTIVFEEYIEGNPLDQITAEYRNDDRKISELLIKISSILQPLWSDKIVHRDLKPSNLIIQESNNPVVIDFGIAKDFDNTSITTLGFQPHTCFFASPEQLLGRKEYISHRTDFFCLSVMSYFLYFGIYPFGNTRDKIEKKFSVKDTSFTPPNECGLTRFWNETLNYYPSERPSRIKQFTDLLEI